MKSNRILNLALRHALVFALGAGLASTAAAQTIHTWTGAAGDNILQTPANWDSALVPSPAAGDTIVWDGSEAGPLALSYDGGLTGAAGNPGLNLRIGETQTAPLNIDSGSTTDTLRLNQVNLEAGAGAFTLGDGEDVFSITLGGTAGQTHVWTNNSDTPATILADVGFNLGGGGNHTLHFTGNGDWDAQNDLSRRNNGNLNLLKTGTGELVLSGGATLQGSNAHYGVGGVVILKEGVTRITGGTFDGSTGEWVVGGTDAVGTNTTLIMDGGEITNLSWLSIGRGNGEAMAEEPAVTEVILNNDATITCREMSAGYRSSTATGPRGTITLNDQASITVTTGNFQIGESSGAHMTLTLNDSSSVTLPTAGSHNIGFGGSIGSTGILNIHDDAVFTDQMNAKISIGRDHGTGIINMSGGAFTHIGELRVGTTDANGVFTGTGTFNLSGGEVNVGSLTVGRGNNNQAQVNGTIHLTGGEFNAGHTGDIILGYAGDHNEGRIILDGGVFNASTIATRWLMVGYWDTSGGRIDVNDGELRLNLNCAIRYSRGNNNAGVNLVNLNGGAITAFSGLGEGETSSAVLDLGYSGSAAADNSFNLNGGVLTIGGVITTSDTPQAVFNFNGGLLKASQSSVNFVDLGGATQRANVRDDGAFIDTNGHNITVVEGLRHSDLEDDAETDGGLTKLGEGTLTLTGNSDYTGPTTISAGVLEIAGTGYIGEDSQVIVDGPGAKLVQTSMSPLDAPVTMVQGTLDGVGYISQVVVENSAANVIGAGNGAAGDLLFDSLVFQGAATLNLRVSGFYPDQYLDTTDLATSAAGKVRINATNTAGVWTSGTEYPLIYFENYPSAADASHFELGDIPGLNPNQTASLVNNAGAIALSVTGDSLVWTGSQSADWTNAAIGGQRNWSYGASAVEFSLNSPVIFNDEASRFEVNLAQDVSPSAIVFENDWEDYVLSSADGFGILTGNLVKNGGGRVKITTDNAFTGGTIINDGVLEISGEGSIASSASIVNHSGLVFSPTGEPNVYANPISGEGSVLKTGAGALTLAGANSFTGDLTLEAGTLNINSPGALGAEPGFLTIDGGVIDNTSGAEVISTTTKGQLWNSDVVFTGSAPLSLGSGKVTFWDARNVTVGGETLRIGPLDGADLSKDGPGLLVINHGGTGTLSGMLNVKEGVVATSEDLYASGITGPGILQNSGLVGSKWLYQTINGELTTPTLIRDNDGSNIRRIGIVKRGTGSWTLNNDANHATGILNAENGVLILNGSGLYGCSGAEGETMTDRTAVVGATTEGNGVLVINGPTVNYNNRSSAGEDAWRGTLAIGSAAASSGAVVLNDGTLTLNRQLGLATGSGGYGSFTQTGGSVTVGGFIANALSSSGVGVITLTGGTYTQNGPVTNGANGVGVMNIGGNAVYTQTPAGDLGLWLGEGGTGVMNVSDSASVTLALENNGVQFGRNEAGKGVLNLTGGVVGAKAFYQGAGTGTLNFNGGTIRANQANTAFLGGLDGAYVYAAGGTVDNAGFNITISQGLLAPEGDGISAAGLSVQGGGFIGAPLVLIEGGGGEGATAVAEVDENGNLTGITITSPGHGYTEPPTFGLSGGGVGNSGVISGTATLSANTGGAMTFTGSGMTTLTGWSSHTGDTIVAAGSKLVVNDSAALTFKPGANGVSNKVTGAGTAYFYGTFDLDLSAASIADGNRWKLVDVTARTFDPLKFTVSGFTETDEGVHQLVDGFNTWTFTESTGELSLAVEEGAGYEGWIAGYGLPAEQREPLADPDSDGYNNLLEYALGGDPTDATLPLAPGARMSGGDFVFSFTRSKTTLASGDVTLWIEYGPDLALWGAPVAVPAAGGVVDGVTFTISDAGDNDVVTASIPANGAVRFFARVKAEK